MDFDTYDKFKMNDTQKPDEEKLDQKTKSIVEQSVTNALAVITNTLFSVYTATLVWASVDVLMPYVENLLRALGMSVGVLPTPTWWQWVLLFLVFIRQSIVPRGIKFK